MILLLITCYNCNGTVYVFRMLCFLCSSLWVCFLGFLSHIPLLLLKPLFFFFSLLSLFSFLIKMAKTKTTPNPPLSVNYKTLYKWAHDELLAETFKITSNKDVITYREGEADEKHCVFGREHDVYMSVQPCGKGEPMCADDRANPTEEPFFFMYSTIFKRVKLRLPFTGFERALLTEVNVAPAELHPNSWAFVPLPSCATTSATPPQWTPSCTSSRRRIPARDCGWAFTEWRESSPNSLPAILQGIQEEVLQSMLQCARPHPAGWVPTLLGGETWA